MIEWWMGTNKMCLCIVQKIPKNSLSINLWCATTIIYTIMGSIYKKWERMSKYCKYFTLIRHFHPLNIALTTTKKNHQVWTLYARHTFLEFSPVYIMYNTKKDIIFWRIYTIYIYIHKDIYITSNRKNLQNFPSVTKYIIIPRSSI